MTEERSFDEVVVERRLSLTGVDGSESTVRRLVGRFEDEGFSEVELFKKREEREVGRWTGVSYGGIGG